MSCRHGSRIIQPFKLGIVPAVSEPPRDERYCRVTAPCTAAQSVAIGSGDRCRPSISFKGMGSVRSVVYLRALHYSNDHCATPCIGMSILHARLCISRSGCSVPGFLYCSRSRLRDQRENEWEMVKPTIQHQYFGIAFGGGSARVSR
jgi:hypothetical protein